MNTALGFVPALPAARTWIFAWGNLMRAWLASDRRKTLCHQRVTRQIMLLEVVFDVLRRPINQRIDLKPASAVRIVNFEARKLRPLAVLKRFPAGERGIISGQSFGQWNDFSDLAASIRIV